MIDSLITLTLFYLVFSSSDSFFPYGPTEGDILLPKRDDHITSPIPIGEGGLKFYGSQRNNLIVSAFHFCLFVGIL